MSSSVTILLENGRRQRVAVKPNTPVLLVLEEVCKKQGLNPDEYELKFHNRNLDLTSTVQFCGVTNNAQLELIPATKSRVQSPVSVFLQLEDGTRLSGSFLPSCTLWNVINELCTDEIKSKENPVIIFTRQEVTGDKLKATTLKMLGLTGGSALLRLLHRTQEQLKNQSVSSIYKLQPKPKPVEQEKPAPKKMLPKSVKEDDVPSVPIKTEASQSTLAVSIESETQKKPIESEIVEKMDTDERSEESNSSSDSPKQNEPSHSIFTNEQQTTVTESINFNEEEDVPFNINEVEYVGDRYALLFKIDAVQSPKFDDQSDEFYELTVEDAKALLRDIKRTRSELEEASLETSAIKARRKSLQIERTLTLYPHCIIRVIFPNRIVLQGVFKSSETVHEVVSFTKHFLETPSLDFYLYISPPKTVLRNDQKLVEIGAVPGINLYFGSESIDYNAPNGFIKEKFTSKLVSPNIALKVANHFRKISFRKKDSHTPLPEIDRDPENDLEPGARPAAIKPPILPKAPSGKVPKWFKKP